MMAFRSLILVLSIFMSIKAHSQKVGVVLSGGGADALAHVGVLKALEEHEIPVDYITGSSMGAMIGAMYASGYTPEDMELFFTSDKFLDMTRGKLDEHNMYNFQQIHYDAEVFNLKFARDSILHPKFPTNVVDPTYIDFELMSVLGAHGASANNDFDSLFIPFRCVAADIEHKREVVFEKGNLSNAVRASMSYPFFLKPITINGTLLFDGGLYNNFPSDIMCSSFQPDYIIGSNVASGLPTPNEDDLISQVKNMLVSPTNYQIDCVSGIVIQSNVEFGVFNFKKAQNAIDSGYTATIAKINSIKTTLKRRKTKDELLQERSNYVQKIDTLRYTDVLITGVQPNQAKFIEQSLIDRSGLPTISQGDVRESYFKLKGYSLIKNIYPFISQKVDSGYVLNLKIKRERDLKIGIGGNLSTAPINHIMLSAQYDKLAKWGYTFYGNGYYGRLYTGAHGLTRFQAPGRVGWFFEPSITYNRFNYFRSRNFFFEEFKPSYLILNELYAKMRVGLPLGNKGLISATSSLFNHRDEYYQTKDFSPDDTTDVSTFNGQTAAIQYSFNTLNNLQFPSRGTIISASMRHIKLRERNSPGSTSSDNVTLNRDHDWFQANLHIQTFYKKRGAIRLGLQFDGVYSVQPLFTNYTSTVLRSPAYQPIPESKTLFLESFRAHQFIALGHKIVFAIRENVEFRLEGYVFQPYQEITKDLVDRTANYGKPWDSRYTIVSGTGVWKTPLGPFSVGLNYYHNVPNVSLEQTTPLSFFLNFGYLIFNDRTFN